MGAIIPTETSIYIAPADTAVATAATDAYKIIGEISNWKISGGQRDMETIQLFGGTVDKIKPREQIEVSFDITASNTASSTLDRYSTYTLGTNLASANDAQSKTIVLKFLSNSFCSAIACNNCRAITWEPEMAADDLLKGTMTFKLSPTTSLGLSNLKTSTLAGSTIPAIVWTSG